MEFKSSKNKDNPNPGAADNKGGQNVSLVILLVLVGGFAYVYFFTGLIKPLEVRKPVEPPAPQVVKKPIPAREGETAKAGAPAAPGSKKGEAAPPTSKPEPPKVAQEIPATVPQVKEANKPKEEAKKPEAAKPSEKKPLPAKVEKRDQKPVAAKPEEKKQPPVEKKQPIAEKKVVAVKKPVENEKAADGKAADKKPVAKSDKKTGDETDKASSGRWTVIVGSYQLEDALAADLARVRKVGLEAAVQPVARKKAQMKRLFLAEYGDLAAAKAELEKLKHHTSDAFVIEQGGKHAVFAGSYLLDERASSEKERLAAAGFSLTLKRAEVPIPSKRLTAGTFGDKISAEAAMKKLKSVGIKASLSRQ